MSEVKTELHKEFELERLILFSDAVFAIAITLIVIEIKFPEISKNATNSEIIEKFKPTILHFAAYVVSFFFIGMSWMRHLRIFRYLVRYDFGLIKRNLFFLFFIVCIPFSVSGLEQMHPTFMLPLIIYMTNIALVFICQYLICIYIFSKKSKFLTAEGFEPEKNYLLLQSKWLAIILSIVAALYLITSIAIPANPWNADYVFFVFVILIILMRKIVKKHKPVTVEDI